MRTIDGDALYKDICRAYDECGDILEIIDKQPTIEPPKGKWKKIHRKCYRCLVCDRVNEHDTPFCPMCGADMRERKEE